MGDANPQSQITVELQGPALPMPQDYYSVLLKVIEAVSKDPAQLRRLVYAMAWHNARPELVLSLPLPIEMEQARTLLELQRMLEFKSAIERVEANVAQNAESTSEGHGTPGLKPAVERLATESAQRTKSISELERALDLEPAGERVKINTAQWASTILDLERAIELKRAVERLEAGAEQRTKTISELERTLELERAIERLATDAARRARTITQHQRAHDIEQAIERVEADAARRSNAILKLERTLELERALEQLEADAAQGRQARTRPQSLSGQSPMMESSPLAGVSASSSTSREPADEPSAPIWQDSESPPDPSILSAEERPTEIPSSENAVIILPEQPPAWLQRTETTYFDRPPPWQNYPIRLSVEMVGDARNPQAQQQTRPNLFSFLQLVTASIMGVALYVGISGWVQLGRQTRLNPEPAVTSLPPAATTVAAPVTAPKVAGIAGDVALTPASPQPAAQQTLPFPLPKTYGIYAGSNGQLTELEPLPIKMPDHRVRLSAEIRTPSRATVASGRLSFVVFRRDLLNTAPQTVSVRVVARVARAMRFVDGKAVYSPIEGAWRIRSNAYELKVSPLEGHREMIVIQPDPGFMFPAGRYALVLNGYGYDFTVPGQVTAPEQCLEQAAMLNGTVLSECSKS